MKVGVLTFHRCINYGSYWQARCLVEGLRMLGHDAELLDHDSSDVRRLEWRCALQPQLPIRTARADLAPFAAKARRLLEAIGRLPRSPLFHLDRPEDAPAYDAILVGSDEVWNFSHPWYGFKPLFFGEHLRTRRLASYAVSFGNYDADEGMEPAWAARLDRFDALSVRDENSRRLVRQVVDREPAVVLDPCLQFPPPRPAPTREPRPYLALYGHNLPAWFTAAVRASADARGCRVMSIGYRNDWADEQRIDAGPEDFAALIAGAEAVATNFFHGCVFALLHRRPFVCAASTYRFNKVHDLVTRLNVAQHLVSEHTPQQTYAALLANPLDAGLEARIDALRTQSSAFLASALG